MKPLCKAQGDSKLPEQACCLLYNKAQSSAFNHVCLVMIIDEIHNTEYWNFLHNGIGGAWLGRNIDRSW